MMEQQQQEEFYKIANCIICNNHHQAPPAPTDGSSGASSSSSSSSSRNRGDDDDGGGGSIASWMEFQKCFSLFCKLLEVEEEEEEEAVEGPLGKFLAVCGTDKPFPEFQRDGDEGTSSNSAINVNSTPPPPPCCGNCGNKLAEVLRLQEVIKKTQEQQRRQLEGLKVSVRLGDYLSSENGAYWKEIQEVLAVACDAEFPVCDDVKEECPSDNNNDTDSSDDSDDSSATVIVTGGKRSNKQEQRARKRSGIGGTTRLIANSKDNSQEEVTNDDDDDGAMPSNEEPIDDNVNQQSKKSMEAQEVGEVTMKCIRGVGVDPISGRNQEGEPPSTSKATLPPGQVLPVRTEDGEEVPPPVVRETNKNESHVALMKSGLESCLVANVVTLEGENKRWTSSSEATGSGQKQQQSETTRRNRTINPPQAKPINLEEEDTLGNNMNSSDHENSQEGEVSGSHSPAAPNTRRHHHRCTSCPKSFAQNCDLKRHLRVHTGSKPFVCNNCGRGFSQSANMRAHQRRAHKIGPKPAFVCEVCGKGFLQLAHLKPHLRTHSGDKPFVCKTCGRGFAQSANLKAHSRTQHNSHLKPFACPTCGKTFALDQYLKRHNVSHQKTKSRLCLFCGKAFAKIDYLNVHLRTHTGEKPNFCKGCGEEFSTHSNLMAHIRSHHQINRDLK